MIDEKVPMLSRAIDCLSEMSQWQIVDCTVNDVVRDWTNDGSTFAGRPA